MKDENETDEVKIIDPCILPKDWNIYQRINWVRSKEHYVKKDASVQGYKAVTHDAVTAALHDLLVQAGIIIYPELKKSEIIEVGKTQNNTTIIRYQGTYVVYFINASNPESSCNLTIEAHANDHGDKAPGKCCSYAQKTGMLKMFSMETGINDEGRIDAKIADAVLKEKISEQAVNWINEQIQEKGVEMNDFMAFLKKNRCGSIEDINNQFFDTVEKMLNSKEVVKDAK